LRILVLSSHLSDGFVSNRRARVRGFAALRDNHPKTVPSLAKFPQSRDGIQGVNIVELPLECKAFDETRGFNG
jgi:hypothetical protein